MRYLITLGISLVVAYLLPVPASTPTGMLIKIGAGLGCWIILSIMVKGK